MWCLCRRGSQLSDNKLAETYIQQVDGVRKVLAEYQGQVHILSIKYRDALENQGRVAAQVNTFPGGGLDEQAIAQTIDSDLRHQCL